MLDKDTKIVSNKIMTPDGTILRSLHHHDYQTYIDKNGLEYMVDGGTTYLRRNVHDDAPYTEMSVYFDAPFDIIRQELHWGTRGKDGKQPLEFKPLCTLDTDHIVAILHTQLHISNEMYLAFEKELEYRCDSV